MSSLAASDCPRSMMSGALVPVVCPGHSRPLAQLHFSNVIEDGFFLISACLDKMPMLRRGETGDWIGTFAGHKGAVWSAKLNAGATQAATASADFTVKIWDALTGAEKHTFDHRHIVKTVDYSPDGARLLSAGMEKKLRVFDLAAVDAEPLLMVHPATVRQALWTPDGDSILTGSDDGNLRVWDVRSQTEVQTIAVGAAITDMEISRDGATVTTASGRTVTVFDTATRAVKSKFDLAIDIQTVSLRPDGKQFVAGGADMWVHVFDAADGSELSVHKGHHGPVHCVRYSPEGDFYASGAGDATVRLWKRAE